MNGFHGHGFAQAVGLTAAVAKALSDANLSGLAETCGREWESMVKKPC